MAGQGLARWRDVHELPRPTAHAGLGPARIVIGHDVVEYQAAFQLLSRALDDLGRLFELLARGQQGLPVAVGPAVILHVGDLDAVRVELQRQIDHGLQVMQVLAVHHHVQGERQACPAHELGGGDLLLVAAGVAADAVAAAGLAVLEGDLHVVQPCVGQGRDPRLVEQHRRGDQVGIEPAVAGLLDHPLQVLAHRGLAAREVDLQHAHVGHVPDQAQPGRGVELAGRALQL